MDVELKLWCCSDPHNPQQLALTTYSLAGHTHSGLRQLWTRRKVHNLPASLVCHVRNYIVEGLCLPPSPHPPKMTALVSSILVAY